MYSPLKKLPMLSETSGQISEIKSFSNLLLSFSSMPQCRKMTSTLETCTRTLRYELRSRDIYIEERTPITSPETLSEPHETRGESVNTIQETQNSQFRLFLLVTPCMPHIDSNKSVNCSPSPHYSAPLPLTTPKTSHLPRT